MEVYFATKDLSRFYQDARYANKKLGARRAQLFGRQITLMLKVENLEELRNLPGHFHELTGDRKGQWACDLDQPYRLIFEPKERPIPTDGRGSFIWVEIKSVEVVEITNYHGK